MFADWLRRRVSWIREHGVQVIGILAIIYMLLPILVIAVFSFNDPEGRFNYEWSGFTFEYWANAFGVEEITESLLVSIRLAALATIGATILGTLLAIALVRHQFHGRRLANLLIVVPMATPEVVIGASLLSLFITAGTSLGFGTLLIAHIMFSISFVVIVVRSRLIGFDRKLEEAASDLGATPWVTFRSITLPLLTPGVVSAAMLAFALSIDDFVISNFNSGSVVTFPLYIFGANQRGIPVQVNVIATMLFVVAASAMLLVIWQQKRAEKLAARRADPADELAQPGAITP